MTRYLTDGEYWRQVLLPVCVLSRTRSLTGRLSMPDWGFQACTECGRAYKSYHQCPPKCECGCGEYVGMSNGVNNRFKAGHGSRGKGGFIKKKEVG
jgi:hypothetical protein